MSALLERLKALPPWAHTLWQTLAGVEAAWLVANFGKLQAVHNVGELERLGLSALAAGGAALASKILHLVKDSGAYKDDPEMVAAIERAAAEWEAESKQLADEVGEAELSDAQAARLAGRPLPASPPATSAGGTFGAVTYPLVTGAAAPQQIAAPPG